MFLILIQEEINAFIELSHLNNNKLTVFKNPAYNNLRDPAITLSLITLRRERAKTDIKTLAKILVLRSLHFHKFGTNSDTLREAVKETEMILNSASQAGLLSM